MGALAKLSDLQIRNAKARDRAYKLSDGGGLSLLVKPDGSKHWWYQYRYHGKQQTMALGVYPAVSARAAREKHAAAREQLAGGLNPTAEKRLAKLKATEDVRNDFEHIARTMWTSKSRAGASKGYVESVIEKLEKDVFPWIGTRPVSKVESPEILAILNRVEVRAPETARRLRGFIGQVFRYAIARGRAKNDPTAALKGAVLTRKAKHFAAITSPARFGELMLGLYSYERGEMTTRCLLQLSPLVFQRPVELREARWDEFDLDGSEWGVPMWEISARRADAEGDTKITRTGWESHLVPLSRQALSILQALRRLTGHTPWVFKSSRVSGRPLSEGAVRLALRRLGFHGEMTAHGFRASARTLAEERLRVPANILELQISHKVADPLGRAYNRTAFLDERIAFMQQWADYLDQLRAEARARGQGGTSRKGVGPWETVGPNPNA
ncbi:tyrosine-type recombinase/integrase [Bordetella sp. H567]|uniref:tyrosine-type recombinase/integrase n=1 Tax=Bordetella sp. H567 TaxID=1697043 RepID=UPI00082D541F|nr:integrase arm-type DNA-binding domain-containing protein [Bordetella sp. H567]